MLSVGPDPVLVERSLVSGELACPECGERLAPWGHAAPRFVRETAESGAADPAAAGDLLGCGRVRPLACAVAAVLPGPAGGCGGGDLGGAAGAGGGAGLAADHRGGGPPGVDGAGLAVPVRRRTPSRSGWRSRGWNAAAAGGADLDRLVPAGGPVADAVAQIGAACAAVRRAAGSAVFAVSAAQMVAACSGGWLLAAAAAAVAAGGGSTRARICDRSPRRVRVDGVTVVDHGKR